MCHLLLVEKNRFCEKLILIAFHFMIKIDFFDKMIFLKILNKHLKMKKVIFLRKKKKIFLAKKLKQTEPNSNKPIQTDY